MYKTAIEVCQERRDKKWTAIYHPQARQNGVSPLRNTYCFHNHAAHVSLPVQAFLESATGKQQNLKGWQKQLLLQARLVGDNADKGVKVGRGSASSGDLPVGVDPRLILAARVLCSPSPEAARSKGASSPRKESTAAALVLIYQYLQVVFSGLGLDAIRDQVLISE